MKLVGVCLLSIALQAVVGSLIRRRDTPDEVKLDMEYRTKDSFGDTALAPACSKITCGEFSCPTPFELKVDGTCCGYCWAPDHKVAVDGTCCGYCWAPDHKVA